MKVQEIMTTDVLTIGPEAEIRDVARIFVERGISGLPVCGAGREVLGIVSEGDIVFKEQGLEANGRSAAVPFRREGREGHQEGARDQGARGNDRSGDHGLAALLGRRGGQAHVRARHQPSSGLET